eukprot:TRINITY_DN1980_c0_g1_i1.p1 TRINITY_DN1980_c0_g1~~TRINITY_DN1980_c0_g1_i1.p1  ORF type:complete len:216 (-),score=31.57 TRINITY_DN1980_c0_g1_i1:260-907(-)
MNMDLLARTGRHKQIYDGEFRLVSGCIPYKQTRNVESHTVNSESMFKVLMISSPNRHDLVFPKGGWEEDESVHEAACREALEEAGVRGNIHETELGSWEFKSKSRQDSDSRVGICKGYMFALEVTEELESWPEQASHERKWLTVRDAYQHCRYDWMREALQAFESYVERHQTSDEGRGGSCGTHSEVADQPIISSTCFVNTANTQLLGNKCSVLG